MASLTTDGLRVALWSTDPLVAGFLQQQLGSLGLDVQVVRDTTPGLLAEFDVLLWDLGPNPEAPEQAVIESPPTVALCTSATIGAAALQSGVRAAVDRSRPPDSLVSVLLAAAAGLMVTEPGWMDTAPPVQTDSPLTPREHEVLELLAEGLSNRDIGQQLFVSEHTVRFHVRAILEKLDATSRTQAVVHAARAGLLDF